MHAFQNPGRTLSRGQVRELLAVDPLDLDALLLAEALGMTLAGPSAAALQTLRSGHAGLVRSAFA